MVLISIAAFIIFIVLFALAARYGAKYSGRILGAKIDEIHRAAEHILETEKAPPSWLRERDPSSLISERSLHIEKRNSLRRLKKMVKYMQRTPTFTDVESREFVISELQRIRELWEVREISELRG
jgi:hypothetical protein